MAEVVRTTTIREVQNIPDGSISERRDTRVFVSSIHGASVKMLRDLVRSLDAVDAPDMAEVLTVLRTGYDDRIDYLTVSWIEKSEDVQQSEGVERQRLRR